MMGRRRQDPVLAAEVEERLHHLLSENAPRRAQPVAEPDRPRSSSATGPELLDWLSEPSLDGDEGDDPAPPTSVAAQTVPSTPASSPSTPPRGLSIPPRGLSLSKAKLTKSVEEGRPWSFGRPHLIVIAVLLIIGLVGAGWAVLRARPVAVATPVGHESPTAALPSRSESSPTPSPMIIMVHVAGAVREPGVVELPDGSRVRDALRKAGGLKKNADPDELNLAQLLSDGQQVMVGTERKPVGEVRDGTGGGGADSSGSAGGGSGKTVNLNTATAEQLETLSGVGPVTAQKIIAWRDEHGRFSRIEELQEVSGIGPKTYAEIAPQVTV